MFQEFNLLPDRTVAENIWLGREPRRGRWSTPAMRREPGAARPSASPDQGHLVRTLSVAEQQIVEIAKAVSYDARVIQMDEPTAALADHEVELLYAIIAASPTAAAILYVSHRLKEIFDLCDTITVLKDGAVVTPGPPPSSTRPGSSG